VPVLLLFYSLAIVEVFRTTPVRGKRLPQWLGRDLEFAYHSDGAGGWILQGVGPDGDIDLENLAAVNFGNGGADGDQVWSQLLPYVYDPTNGAVSSGDIFRLNQ